MQNTDQGASLQAWRLLRTDIFIFTSDGSRRHSFWQRSVLTTAEIDVGLDELGHETCISWGEFYWYPPTIKRFVLSHGEK